MQIYKFTTKLNKLDNNIYSIEEEINVVNGKYKGFLKHDNVNINSLNIYTGSKLTGEKINSYILSTPSETPWKTEIELYTKLDTVYITYETVGDTIEAEDINILQDSIVYIQEEFNKYQKSNDNKVSELIENKVDKVQGKQLSTNDYTNAEKDKLSNIEENANRYIHPNDSNIRHVTDAEKDIWNSKETVEGSQAKSTKALNDAKSYTNTKINDLIGGEVDTYNTLKKLEDAIKNHELEYSDLLTLVNKKADSSHNHDSVYLGKNDNSVSATKLQTARTLTIGSTGKAFDGSVNVSWTLSEIGAAPDGYGLVTTCQNKSNQDCNNILTTGFYMGSNMTNKPSGCTQGWIYLLVMRHNDSWVRQVAYDFATVSQVYTRVKQNGSWTSWVATDTNTWRGVQDNLTSSLTDQSLSANQGRVLKGMIDEKANSSHNHTKSQISDFPTKLSQFEDDLGIGQLPSQFTWNMLKGV